MWSNFVGFIDPSGVPLRNLADLAGIVNLPGLQRWRYVTVEPGPAERRPSRNAVGIVRPTRGGRAAQSVWAPLAGTVETRWAQRFGAVEVAELLTHLPSRDGSKEAVSVSLGFLERVDCVIIAPDPAASRIKVARLTPKGLAAQAKYRRLLAQTDERWITRYGLADVDRLRSALTAVLTGKAGDHPKLAEGLAPYDDGWRAHPPYADLTKAMLADPLAVLPHYPMVSHRGGFPDGS